jgi:hypothetical protein
VVTFSPSYRDCQAQPENQAAQNQLGKANQPSALPIRAKGFFICEGVFANANGNAITAVATVLLMFVTGGLVRLGWIQLLTTRTQLRAQIFPLNFMQWWTPDTPVKGQYSWRFRPIWQNSGETAGEDVVIVVECEVRNSAIQAGYDFDNVLDAQIELPGLMAPKATLQGGLAPATPQSPITPQDLADSQNGHKFIYLFGRAHYCDVFPRTRDHITRFCWLVYSQGDPFTFVPNDPNHALNFSYVLHTEFNYTEDV